MNRVCVVCGISLDGKRADTKTCGSRCRNSLSTKRKKNRAEVVPRQEEVPELLEEKIIGIEEYLQRFRMVAAGKSRQFRQGMILRALFEIEEAARSILPELNATTSAKQRSEERWDLLRKMGWA